MLFKRNTVIIMVSILFIAIIIWWQKPGTAVSAMAGGNYQNSSYGVVKNYWEKMDCRQFNIASGMIASTARSEHSLLEKQLANDPFLSVQKVEIDNGPENNTFYATVHLGSVIDQKTEAEYFFQVDSGPQGLFISSMQKFNR